MGVIRLKRAGRDIDIRVSTVPTSHGERVVMRLLDRSAVLKPLDDLGFAQSQLDGVDRLIKRSHGYFGHGSDWLENHDALWVLSKINHRIRTS